MERKLYFNRKKKSTDQYLPQTEAKPEGNISQLNPTIYTQDNILGPCGA